MVVAGLEIPLVVEVAAELVVAVVHILLHIADTGDIDFGAECTLVVVYFVYQPLVVLTIKSHVKV